MEQEQEQDFFPQAPSSLSPSPRLVHLDLSQNLFTSVPAMQGLDRLEVLSLQVSGHSSVHKKNVTLPVLEAAAPVFY